MTETEKREKTKPEMIFKAGLCTASVFANEISTQNGKATVKSVSLGRAYMDKGGAFQKTSSFRVEDLPKAILALEKAYEYLALEEKSFANTSDGGEKDGM